MPRFGGILILVREKKRHYLAHYGEKENNERQLGQKQLTARAKWENEERQCFNIIISSVSRRHVEHTAFFPGIKESLVYFPFRSFGIECLRFDAVFFTFFPCILLILFRLRRSFSIFFQRNGLQLFSMVIIIMEFV